ncbi:VOC family protein [Streptomyces sp. NPDC005438]|uniref:VOC family protein n=1 Tax=Streptomyces sp. NPDC005438 TaxID=3156880 RepID=UPI0033BB2120
MTIASLGVYVLDCPDPGALARFYATVIGGTVRGEGDWVEVESPEGTRVLAFQRSEGYIPPRWPGQEHSQQAHLDFDLPRDRWPEAGARLIELGARLVQDDGDGARNFVVYLDPVGHPFCLCD